MSQFPPLPWGRHWLESKIGHFLEALAPKELEALTQYVSNLGEFRWGSSCSGTESPAWVIKDLFTVLERKGVSTPKIVTVVCAEQSPEKCAFIVDVCPLSSEQMYYDMRDLLRKRAYCRKADCRRKPNVAGLTVFVAGFSCKSVSGLASGVAGGDGCIINNDTRATTSDTFDATVRIVQLHSPTLVMLENVLGLRRGDQHLIVIERLHRAGYVVRMWELHTSGLGIPHDRQRLWFLGLHKSAIQRAGWTELQVEQLFETVMSRLYSDAEHGLADLDSFLLHENDMELQDLRASVMSRRNDGSLSGSTGPGDAHMSMDTKCYDIKAKRERVGIIRSYWTPDLEFLFPTYLLLSEREKCQLDHYSMKFPDTEQRKVMSLAQQQASTGYGGVSPCIVPTCVMWVGERSRLLRGCEGIRLQGVFLDREQERKYDSAFLMDLAGNAFSTPCVAVVLLTGLVTLGLMFPKLDVSDPDQFDWHSHFLTLAHVLRGL